MKKSNVTFLYILIVLFISNEIMAQNQANNWYFGTGAGMTFNTNPPTLLTNGQTDTREGCSTISDTNGKLLFYTDGVTVWDSLHNIMPNGTGLFGDISSTQSAIIIPAPGSISVFYIVTTPYLLNTKPLAFSVVDMTLNNGLGDVTTKNDTLLALASEKVTAVKHQNGTDVWIIAHAYTNNNFYAFLLTSSGINQVPVISSAGNSFVFYNNMGYLKGSHCGNQLAMASYNTSNPSRVELFDFDNATGIVSNPLVLGEWVLTEGIYGIEFSPDNSKLYASITIPQMLIQYDLSAGSPAAIIASLDTIGISTDILAALQLGPDGKIYVARNITDTLGCITDPNLDGTACGYVEYYYSLGTGVCKLGLPNFPAYFLCNLPSGLNSVSLENEISVYPNPFVNTITVSVQGLEAKKINILIKNILGQSIFDKSETGISNSCHELLDLSHLAKGIYFLEIVMDKEMFVRKIIKE
jgi:hypothetical protein